MPENFITRENLSGLIPEEFARGIIQGATESSAVLKMGRRLPNMTSKTLQMNVLDMLPTAYFINGDNGTKKLTKQAWDKKKIYAEEIAVIVPIPEAVLDDANYDIWGEVKPRISEAFGRVIDGAILFGTNKPETWRKSVYDTCVEKSAVIVRTSDVYSDIFAEAGALALVEESGFDANGIMAAVKMKSALRGLKDLDGHPLYKATMQGKTTYDLEGIRMEFPMNGAFDTTAAQMIVGDWKQLVYAIRQDIEYKIFTEGVVQDPATGEILYNLMQNDMVALRAVMRLGWEIPNPISAFNADNENRCPFAVYTPNLLGISLNTTFADDANLYGKVPGDLMEGNKLVGNTLYGTSKHVTGYTGFSGDPDEQSGYYFACNVTAVTGATVKVQLLGGMSGPATCGVVGDGGYDGLHVFKLDAGDTPYYDKILEITAEKGGVTAKRRVSLAQIQLEG